MKNLQIADLFCGAGGTSAGAVEAAEILGYQTSLTAINHWGVAIATHQANHPDSRHLCTSLDNINPLHLYKEDELDVLWASPECTHHSCARGGKPINDQSRSTAWCVVRWAEALRPKHILVENVPEFETWGAIGTNGRPLATKRGATFLAWVGALESLGYVVGWRVLCAADYGDPTTRRRLFVQCVRGRRKIVWPNPTHCPAGEVDMFGSRKPWATARNSVIDWSLPGKSIYERKYPLSKKTMERIMDGLNKFGLKPFIVPQQTNPTPKSVDVPLPTVCAEGSQAKLVEAFIMSAGGPVCSPRSVDLPVGTVLCRDHRAIVEPFLVPQNSSNGPRSIDTPAPTVTTTSRGIGLVEAALLPQGGGGVLRPVDEPVPTVHCDGAIALVEPYLISYYGTGGPKSVDNPLKTVTAKDRMGLVRPEVVIDGQRYRLDIRFRMLQPHELAAAQGFRKDYKFTGNKSDRVKQIGNAVPRRLARALVLAVLSQKSDVSKLLEHEIAA